MDRTLETHLKAGHLALTANKRLARLLAEEYDRRHLEAGHRSWPRPQIVSLQAWIDAQLAALPEDGLRLSKLQCLNVWEQIVDADRQVHDQALLQVPQAAKRGHQAHQLLLRYRADFSYEQAAPDHQAFLRWREQWQRFARRHGWRDPAEDPDLLADALTNGRLAPPAAVVLAGFDDLPPDVVRLQTALRESGCQVTQWEPPSRRDNRVLRLDDALDPADEVRCCARWVRQLLERDPHASIGVVVPQLEAYRSAFDTIFPAELDPASLLRGEEVHDLVNISLPSRLDREGSVRTALTLLQLGPVIELETLCRLIRSPYVGDAARERFHRGRLDRRLRDDGRLVWPIGRAGSFAKRYAEKDGLTACGISRMLAACAKSTRDPLRRRPGDWAELFLNQLYRCGWPGERAFSSREYQVLETFQAVFVDMAKLDGVSGPVAREAAVAILTRLTKEHPFQPESKSGSVQVLGLLEAGGLSFDHLWVAGLHDAALPQAPEPNPFIPLAVQRRYEMQRADAERERLFAARIAERLFAAADDVVLSWPRSREGLPQRPSSLIRHYDSVAPSMAASVTPHARIFSQRPLLETLSDHRAPTLHSRKPFSGGTGILKDQALCPFRAFAHYRLRAKAPEPAEIGLDNMERGSLVHHALEFFWKAVRSRDKLLSLSFEHRSDAIDRAVDNAIERFEKERRRDIPNRLRMLEKTRLSTLLDTWLEIEAGRPRFRIEAAETHREIAIGGLQIRTRIDRIDDLDGRGLAVIDYKTGRPDVTQWFGERITEPQLPLYCLAIPAEQVAAVLFAQVRGKASENRFLGIIRHSGEHWPGLRAVPFEKLAREHELTTFDDVLSHWRQTLEQLGGAFVDGDATVDPVDRKQACAYCDLTPLCRISDAGDAALSGETTDV